MGLAYLSYMARVKTYLILLSFFLFMHSGFAASREAYAKAAFTHLGFYLNEIEYLLTPNWSPDLAISAEELRMFRSIRDIAVSNRAMHAFQDQHVWNSNLDYKFDLRFASDQKRFELDDQQAPRTAMTTAEKDFDIYFNLPLINSDKAELGYLDFIQLMIHEVGHKTQNKNQAAVDSLAAKIKQILQRYYLQQVLPDGRKIEMLNISRMKNDTIFYNYTDPNRTPFEPAGSPYKQDDSFSVIPLSGMEFSTFIIDKGSVTDLSSIYNSVYSDKSISTFQTPEQFKSEIGEFFDTKIDIKNSRVLPAFNSGDQVIQIQFVKSEGVFKVEGPKESHWVGAYPIASATKSMYVNVKIPLGQNPSIETHLARRGLLNYNIKVISADYVKDNLFSVRCEIPESLNNQSIDLALYFGSDELLVKGQPDGPGIIKFDIDVPQNSDVPLFYYDRLVLNKKNEVFLNIGHKIDLAKGSSSLPVKLLESKILQSTNIGKVHFRAEINSAYPLQQIKIIRKQIVDEYGRPSEMPEPDPLMPNMYSNTPGNLENKTANMTETVLTAHDFTQYQNGDKWIVEADIDESKTKTTYSYGTEFTHRISSFFKTRSVVYSPSSADSGQRILSRVEIINSALQTASVKVEKNYNIFSLAPSCTRVLLGP